MLESNTLIYVLFPDCGYVCDKQDDFYFAVNKGRCDIFHRCIDGKVYTEFCAPGTFFDPSFCACRHTNELPWCRDDGAVLPGANTDRHCIAGSNS